MQIQPKILLCCPINRVKDYCMKDWLNSIRNLTYNNLDIYLCDNSSTKEYAKHINEMGIKCGWVNPIGKSNPRYIAESHEDCRQKAMQGKYDYMFHLECDIFVPCSDIIERLLLTHKRIVSAMYHIKHGKESHLCIGIKLDSGDPNFVSTMLLKDGIDLAFVDGTVKEVYSAGLGCTLIHRSIFEKIKFRDGDNTMHPDSWMYIDLHTLGIKSYVDTSLLCEHKNEQWLHY